MLSRLWLLLMPLTVAGCGLADYEQRAEHQRLRLKRFDEENRYLGEPMSPPWFKTKDGADLPVWPFDVYLRPFQGTASRHEETTYAGNNLVLFRFPGKDGYHLLMAAANIGELNKDGKYQHNEFSVADFRDRVRGALVDYYQKEYKFNIQFPDIPAKRVTIKPFQMSDKPQPDLEFDAVEYADWPTVKEPTYFFVHYYQRDPRQLAIIHQAPMRFKDDPGVRKAVEMSLRTLAIEKAAENKRNEYYKTHKK